MPNRFVLAQPVYESHLFVGRGRDLRDIADKLAGTSFDSIELIGERRVGKTSLLHQLTKDVIVNQYGLGINDGFVGVHMDMGNYRKPADFWKDILKSLQLDLKQRAPLHPILEFINEILGDKTQEISNDSIRQLEREARSLNLRIFLMCDEFEKIAHNPNFDYSFYGEMRALLISPNIAMITATRYPLTNQYTQQDILGSPFFNVFVRLYLKGFSEEGLDEFIDVYQKHCDLEFSKQDILLIDRLGGYFPFYMQIAASKIEESRRHIESKELAASEAPTWVSNEFLAATDARFLEMWNGFDTEQQNWLLRAIDGQINLDMDVKRPLSVGSAFEKRGLLVKRAEKFSVFSYAFSHWIRVAIKDKQESGGKPTPFGETTRVLVEASSNFDYEKPYVFVSYSRKNDHFVHGLVDSLNAEDIEAWMDLRNIAPMENWDDAIAKAVGKAQIFVVVLSPPSMASQNVKDEINLALTKKKVILPILYEDCEIYFRLGVIQHIDFRQNQEDASRNLVKAIKQQLKG